VWADGIGTLDSRDRIRKQRRQAGMVFQLHHLIGRLSALQNVLTGRLAYHSAIRSLFPLPNAEVVIAMECLERVGLVDKALKRVDQLSGGERQRVGIARTLAQRPRIMLADEPVASLDPATAESIMELLSRVAREDNLTVVFSMHQLELASRFGDRVIGLADGAIVFDGPPAELTTAPLGRIYNGAAGAASPPVVEPGSTTLRPPLENAACDSRSAFAGFSHALHLDRLEQPARSASQSARG
jgi:phosphonate transport system ATP-binding protein